MPRGTQGKYQATSRKVFSFLISVDLKDGPKACRFSVTWSHNQHNEGSNPKTGRVRDPINKKTS